MAQLIIDNMDDVSPWSALAADGLTASTAMTLATDPALFRYGADKTSLRITTAGAAQGHFVHRVLPALDLTSYDELRFWVYSSRTADNGARGPFFLEVKLASAAMDFTDPANTWLRYLPIAQPRAWELMRLHLFDLAPVVRGAVSAIRLRCTSATPSFTVNLDDLIATRDEMLLDVDAALVTALHENVSVGGTPVPALVHHPTAVLPTPAMVLRNYYLRPVHERRITAEQRSNFTDNVYLLLPEVLVYEVYYEIDVRAATRPDKARILDFVLATLSPRAYILNNGVMLPVEHVSLANDHSPLRLDAPDQVLLRFRVETCRALGVPTPVTVPYNEIVVAAELPT